MIRSFVVVVAAVAVSTRAHAQDRGAVLLGELAQGLGVSARVLMIGAHPDDEDTQLITWLARGRQVETAYLSLTRGDGGQNLIGNELGEALGAIRTEELLAARKLDGGRQYFTRAYDFGFSKSADETYKHWPHDSVLGDVVTVIRAFRPHVIVSVFSGTRRDGHGHHEVSGLLAREGYDVAADTVRFPVRLHGRAWTPLKFYRGARSVAEATLSIDVGEFSPLRGRSYAELAAESRSQHKSQAFGSLQRKGVVLDYLRLEHARGGMPADPKAERSLFDGIDTSWTRFLPSVAADGRPRRSERDSLPQALAAVRETMNLFAPSSIVAPLQQVWTALSLLTTDAAVDRELDLERRVEIAQARFTRLLTASSGLAVEATAEREVYAVGDSIPVRVTVYNRGPTAINYSPRPLVQPTGMPRYAIPSLELLPGASQQWVEKVLVDQRSQPWWLSQPRNGDLFTPRVIGIAEDATGTPVVVGLNVRWGSISGGITAPVEFRIADPLRGEVTKPVVAAPAVSVILAHAITYVPANRPVDRQIRVSLRSASSDARNVIVSLAVPPGLRADSNARTIALPAGGTRDVDFLVRGRLASGTHVLRASAMVAGARYDSGYVLVEYDHIRPQRLYRAAEMQLRAVDVVIPPRATVAYIQGVGDNVAGPLRDLGLPVTVIDPRDLSTTDLSKFTAVVIGPRAYESSDALVEQNARVLNYARGGGTVVVQYGQYEMMRPGMLPYAITLTRPADRVTVEEAPVRVLAPASPLLNYPNKIGERDFDGWVQERGLYMPREFDPNWTPLFALSDPGEPENRGAVLVAPVGRGLYVYTTFSLFRQLPAAVPGAARLIINLIAATQGTGVTQ